MEIFLRILSTLGGVWVGAVIGALIIVGAIRRRIENAGSIYSPNITAVDREKLDDISRRFKKAYKDNNASVLLGVVGLKGKKRNSDGVDVGSLLSEVAKVFNPDSKNPMFELTGGEAFEFGHTVTDRLVGVFDASGLTFLRNITLETFFKYADAVKKAANNKLLGGAIGSYNGVMRIVNIVNPYYWIKRTVTAIVVRKTCDAVVFTGVDVLVKEFANLYRKTSRRFEREENIA